MNKFRNKQFTDDLYLKNKQMYQVLFPWNFVFKRVGILNDKLSVEQWLVLHLVLLLTEHECSIHISRILKFTYDAIIRPALLS